MAEVDARRRAASVGAVARLSGVSLHHCDFDLEDPDPQPPFALDSDLSVSWAHNHPVVVYNVRFDFSAVAADEEVFFSGRLGYFVIYELPEVPSEWDGDDLEAFGEISATFAAWPYIRELMHSLTARADVPPLVLDVLRAPIEAAQQIRVSPSKAKKSAPKKSTENTAAGRKRSLEDRPR